MPSDFCANGVENIWRRFNEQFCIGRQKILIVDDEEDVRTVLESEIMDDYPNCVLEKAGTYESAKTLLGACRTCPVYY